MAAKSGFIVLNKAAGASSAQAIAKVKKKLKLEKIGHAGTLDPFATGLLVILVNRATKLASLVGGGEKTYLATFRFGVKTDTDDKTGKVIKTSSYLPRIEDIERILPHFSGTISQSPPLFSAVKIQGKRAYKRARANEDSQTTSKQITINSIKIDSLVGPDLSVTISCGSGTYIRSIARDMGEALGTCATVLALKRISSLPFALEQIKVGELYSELIPWHYIFPQLQKIKVSDSQAQALKNGDERVIKTLSLPEQAVIGDQMLFQLAENSATIGILDYTDRGWKLWAYMGE